ncbi:MauE/DoxX family redox-associated membrane protein [Mucilaginibacter sp. P19]|uniref:MauE/DoxX family redox-associated membrane protein n=1 Tax=Mucilaginibacter sp. P19 TaxID=3423947 RepID=UPI003D66D538
MKNEADKLYPISPCFHFINYRYFVLKESSLFPYQKIIIIMKKVFTLFCTLLFLILFAYTSTSKFLDYEKFVFQMKLAPVTMMSIFAPVLGWLIPAIEAVLTVALSFGIFDPAVNKKALLASVILLSLFEAYIAIMLLSGSQLPCTCGGIISFMRWKQHLVFNAFFIIAGSISIWLLNKLKHENFPLKDNHKTLSRA